MFIPLEAFEAKVAEAVYEYQNNINQQAELLRNNSKPSSTKNKYEGSNYSIINESVSVIEYFDTDNVLIECSPSGFRNIVSVKNLTAGKIKDPLFRKVFNVGYIGIGPYRGADPITRRSTFAYNKWYDMMRRCYDRDIYTDSQVCNKWHNFQMFAAWYDYYACNYPMDETIRWSINRTLFNKRNKFYDPATCCLLPDAINSCISIADTGRSNLPTGIKLHTNGKYLARINKYGKLISLGSFATIEEAFYNYKKEKEAYIRELAKMYSYTLPKFVVDALLNYEVEIDD